MSDSPTREIVRDPERQRMTGLGRVQWWRLEKRGDAPRRIQLGANSIGWFRDELEAWVQERVDQRDIHPGQAA